jgi:hypothetical protein
LCHLQLFIGLYEEVIPALGNVGSSRKMRNFIQLYICNFFQGLLFDLEIEIALSEIWGLSDRFGLLRLECRGIGGDSNPISFVGI